MKPTVSGGAMLCKPSTTLHPVLLTQCAFNAEMKAEHDIVIRAMQAVTKKRDVPSMTVGSSTNPFFLVDKDVKPCFLEATCNSMRACNLLPTLRTIFSIGLFVSI